MSLLSSLKITKKNFGASTGKSWWSATKNENEINSINPATNKIIGSVYAASSNDYEHILHATEKAFQTWRNIPVPKRGEMIRLMGNALREKKIFLAELISLEMGKSKQEALGEVQEMIDMADFAVGQSRMLYGNTMHSERPEHRLYEQWHPLGVVAVMTAFNFPVAVWAWNAFIAAIAGNVVMWKPSPKTPLTAIAVQHICNAVMKQCGVSAIFSLFITDNNLLVDHMAADNRIALLSFTGSTEVGRKINTIVSKRLGKVLLELSGNNAVILDETANVSQAIPSLVFGAIGTAGQRCTTIRRLIIQEKIYNDSVHALIRSYKKIRIGDPLNEKNTMGPLIDAVAVEHFLETIREIKKCGGKILFGGKLIKRDGFFVEPTLVEVNNKWDVVQRENFSPILYLMKYKHIEEAIAMQNHSAYGLSSALFTDRLQHAELFLSARGSDCGIANINIGTSGAEIGGAFGGEKNTGGGREAGSDAWKVYMRRQTNTIHWGKVPMLSQGIMFDS